MFAGVNKKMIRKAAIRTKGGSKPLAMGADGWRILCLNKFGNTNIDLRKAIANFCRSSARKYQPMASIEALVAC